MRHPQRPRPPLQRHVPRARIHQRMRRRKQEIKAQAPEGQHGEVAELVVVAVHEAVRALPPEDEEEGQEDVEGDEGAQGREGGGREEPGGGEAVVGGEGVGVVAHEVCEAGHGWSWERLERGLRQKMQRRCKARCGRNAKR